MPRFNRKYIFHPGPFFIATLVYRSVTITTEPRQLCGIRTTEPNGVCVLFISRGRSPLPPGSLLRVLRRLKERDPQFQQFSRVAERITLFAIWFV